MFVSCILLYGLVLWGFLTANRRYWDIQHRMFASDYARDDDLQEAYIAAWLDRKKLQKP